MRESPAEASEDSQNDSKPQTADTSQNSNSETNSQTFVEFDSTSRLRKGFRRKKGESPYICDMNVKFKKEKNSPLFLTQILGLDLLVLEIQLLFTLMALPLLHYMILVQNCS